MRRSLVAYAPRDDAETVMSNEVRHLLRLFFRWSWRRAMPSSINGDPRRLCSSGWQSRGHLERSERSPPFIYL